MSIYERYRRTKGADLAGLAEARARLEAVERRRAVQTAQQVAAGQLLLHDPEVRLAMGPEQEAEAYERLNELEASIGLKPTPYVDVPKQEFAKHIYAGQVKVAEQALPAAEREALLEAVTDDVMARFGPERVARYMVNLRNEQTLMQAQQAALEQGKAAQEATPEPPMEARQWVRSLIEPHAPSAVGKAEAPARSVAPYRWPAPVTVTDPAVPTARPRASGPAISASPRPDLGRIMQKRRGYLPTAGARMRAIVDPYASGKNKRAANAELLEKAFDLEPKEAARIAALPAPQQLAELKKMKAIEANADQSQNAWTEMITARMMPEGVDPKSPEGRALAQQAKQFAQDTWSYFRLTQPSAEAAKGAVQGSWTQYVAQARTHYANAGLPYDEDAVKRVLFLAGDTQAFEHAGATGKAPVGAGFVPPTDTVGARGLDPEFARRLANVQADMAKEGIEVRLKEGGRSGYRTHEDQVAMRGGKRGKWAAQGVSTHEVAHSYDLELWVKGVKVKPGAREWETLGRVATANGLYWGKNFITPGPEEWHVQLYAPGQDPDIEAANAAAAKAKARKEGGRKGGAPAPKRKGEAEPTTSLAQSVAPPSVGPAGPGWGVTLTSAPSGGAAGAGGATQPTGKPAGGKPAAQPAGKRAKGGAKKSEGIDPSKAVATLPSDPKLLATFLDECEKTGVDPAFALSVGWWETRGKWTQGETSGAGAHGVMALMPNTARNFGATDPDDPYQNVRAGVDYIEYLLGRPRLSKKRLGNKQNDHIVAAYNWGETKLKDYGIDAAYPETKDFIVAVRTLMPQFKVLLAERAKQAAGGAGGKK